MIAITTRLGVPARLLAATGTPFQGRTVSTDRRNASLEGRIASGVGFGSPVGLGLNPVPTTIPRGNP